jgi:hypothetical protein
MIETAADSSAVLMRDGESIVIAPNSRMGLPASNDSEYATLILQQFGTLMLKVDKQQTQHFEVKTPYLAAVVKGTTFTVNVDSAGASVHVLEGAVQVANPAGMMALIRPGQTAKVSSSPGADLSVQGKGAKTPTQQSENTPDPDSAKKDKTASPASKAVAKNASAAAPAGFVIKDTVGAVDIDITKSTNGLIQSAQAPGQNRAVNPGKGKSTTGVTGASNSVTSAGADASAGGGIAGSSNSASLGSVAGGAPAAAGGNPHGGPVAAGQTGVLPATASAVAQVAASLGSNGNNGKSKKEK